MVAQASGHFLRSVDLPVVEGLDTKDGLMRLAGNRRLYRKLLHQFVEQQGMAPSKIDAALAHGDRELAGRLAHTLKGVASSVGAKAVQGAAGALEALIHQGIEDIAGALQGIVAALDPLLAQLRAAFDGPGAVASPSTSPQGPADLSRSREAAAELCGLGAGPGTACGHRYGREEIVVDMGQK